jgi:hypothetical protein
MKDIFAVRLYTRVARLGGFSAAAGECELSQSQASRMIADLESDLGTRLLSRGTRAVVPTAAFPTNDIKLLPARVWPLYRSEIQAHRIH